MEQISSPHSPSRRGGGDKGPFPNATAAEGAGREETLNSCSLSALPGKIMERVSRDTKGLLRAALLYSQG